MAARFRPLVLLLILSSIGAACAAPGTASVPAATATAESSPAAHYPVTVTDDSGRDVTLDAQPRRIVSLAPSNTEIVCALGACDLLVGVTDFDDFPPQVTEVEDVVIQTQVDVEKVIDAQPDLVLAAGNELTPTPVIEQLDELGYPVLILYPETLEEVYADIALVGEAIARQDAAEGLVDEMERRADAVTETVAGADTPLTYYEVFYADGAVYTAGEGSFIASLIDRAGGEPVTGDALGTITLEELIDADPELILLGSASYDPSLADPDGALAAVAARPGFSTLRAVQEGRVVPYLADVVTTRPGPRIVEGLEALARAIHPDLFD